MILVDLNPRATRVGRCGSKSAKGAGALRAPAPNWIQMRVINAYPDIGYQLAIQAPSLLLGEGLTLQQIVSQFGPPQQVRERVITTQDREVKPISVKEYGYANGAIVFAVESDSQAPDTIEMAFLNVSVVKAGLSSEGVQMRLHFAPSAGIPLLFGLVLTPLAAQSPRSSRGDVKDIATDTTDPTNSSGYGTQYRLSIGSIPNASAVVAFSGSATATVGAPVWKSDDGGLTWRKVNQLLRPSGISSLPNDQKIAFDAQGRLFVAALGITPAKRHPLLYLPPDRHLR